MDLIVPLHSIEALGVEGHRMPLAILQGLLRQDSTGGKVGAVCLNLEELIII